MKKQISLIWMGLFLLGTSMANAKPTVLYEKAVIESVYVTDYFSPERGVANLIDGSGLSTDGSHVNTSAGLWMGGNSTCTNHDIVFKFDQTSDILGMNVWNCNWSAVLDRGVKDFEVYYSTSHIGMIEENYFTEFDDTEKWTKLDDYILPKATGAVDYKGEYFDLSSLPTDVRMIGLKITSAHGTTSSSFGWVSLCEVEFYRPMPLEASLSGTTMIEIGETTQLVLDLKGNGPFNVKYSDGTSDYELNDVTANRHVIDVNPNETTTYTLLSVTGAIGEAKLINTEATIEVTSTKLIPYLDGTMRQADFHDGYYVGQELSLKSTSEIYNYKPVLMIDIESLDKDVENAVLKVFLNSTNKDNAPFSCDLALYGVVDLDTMKCDATMGWYQYINLKSSMTELSSVSIDNTDLQTSLTFDLTAHLNAVIESGCDTLLLFMDDKSVSNILYGFHSCDAALVNQPKAPKLLYIANESIGTNAILPVINNKLVSYPNPFVGGVMTFNQSFSADAYATVYSVLGSQVAIAPIVKGQINLTMPMSAGYYMVRITDNDKIFSAKFQVR